MKNQGGLRLKGISKKTDELNPLITIITVVLNRVQYIEQAILSVLNQTYSNIEYIIVDGGSIDGTLDLIKKYQNRIDYWVSEPDDGMYYALNKGIGLSNGQLIGVCHSDDYYYSNGIIKYLVEIYQKYKADIYHGDGISLIKALTGIKMTRLNSNANTITSTHNSILHPTTFISRDIFDKFGVYETRYKSASDYELMLRLKKNGCKFHHLGKVVAVLRINNINRVSNNCYSHLEAYSFHKYHKTGNHNKYFFSYLECKIKRILRSLLSLLKFKYSN